MSCESVKSSLRNVLEGKRYQRTGCWTPDPPVISGCKDTIINTGLGKGTFTLRKKRDGEYIAAVNGFVVNPGEKLEVVRSLAEFEPWT